LKMKWTDSDWLGQKCTAVSCESMHILCMLPLLLSMEQNLNIKKWEPKKVLIV